MIFTLKKYASEKVIRFSKPQEGKNILKTQTQSN